MLMRKNVNNDVSKDSPIKRWPRLTVPSTFKIWTWVVKEPTHYSKRVEREVPGVVAVLLSSKCGRLGVTFLKKGLWCMRPRTQKEAQVKKEPCRVVDNVECRCNAQCKWENKSTPLSGRHYLWQGSRITRVPVLFETQCNAVQCKKGVNFEMSS